MRNAKTTTRVVDTSVTPPEVNSLEWWENHFSGDWLRYEGPGQTRHFVSQLVASLPAADKELLRQHARTVADWGCAFGEGSTVLAETFPKAKVCGFDTSARAIEQASQRHAPLEFIRLDPDVSPGVLPRRFDLVVNSNCLEHFERWQDVLRANLASTLLLHVSLVPYREQPLSVHHVVSLSEDSFPAALDGFTRLMVKTVDVDRSFWPSGKQLLVAYASPRYLSLRERPAGEHEGERAKWDAYYADLALQPIDAPTAAFNEELTGIVRELLPTGGAVLEAGCGGGSQSLSIANAGYAAALLDFSPAALDYARRLFEANGAKADFILGDAFAEGERQHDLVFNAGVLEHYTLDEQSAFLRGMASRSRRYVLVLIPNRACYWYWLWRVRRAAGGAWPFGKEVPQTQLADAFQAAGLHYIGQTFVGEGWTEAFINDCGLDEATREQFLRIHRSPLLPAISKGYLLAALGSVEPVDEAPARWQSTAEFDERSRADWMAALADALAGRIAAEQRLASEVAVRQEEIAALRREIALEAQKRADTVGPVRLELQRRLDELNVLNGKLMESQRQLTEVSDWANHVLAEERERSAAERFEAGRREQEHMAGLTRLQGELRQASEVRERVEAELTRATQEADRLIEDRAHLAAELDAARAKEAALAEDRARLAAELDAARAKEAALAEDRARLAAELDGARAKVAALERTFTWRATSAAARGLRVMKLAVANPLELARRVYVRLPMSPATRYRTSAMIRRVIRKAPSPVAPSVAAVPGAFAPAPARDGFAAVFVFAIIDWHFRIQRPQHLSRELARLGHRVFYVSNHFVDEGRPGFQLEPLDADGRLFQVHLKVRGSPAIYFAPPSAQDSERLLESLCTLLLDVRPVRSIALVEHPYWWDFAQRLPNSTVVYDCMDHHEGFGGMPGALLEIERSARRGADVLVTTSDWLLDRFRPERPRIELVRNACDFDFFSVRPTEVWRDPAGRRVVGYYGAIAEWFDVDLLDRLASELPDACFRLVGSDTAGAAEKLSRHANVTFVGERPYTELPFHLYGFDVCLMPFKVIPLTLATNPVKLYEYLAAGRSVVSVDLPELRQFGDLVFTAADHDEFVAKVKRALAEPPDAQTIARRQEFASRQTWRHRATALADAFRTAEEPRVSVIVLTHNNLPLTQACLKSLAESDYPNLELVVVDNHSTDGSPEWLREWAESRPDTHLVLNDTNTGFAGGNNIGLRVATGEYLVILNNDTYVTRGWVRSLLAHFKRNPKLGLLCPVTNNIGNEAKIEIEYGSMEEMATRSQGYTLAHPGHSIRLRTVAFFCVMMRRAVFEEIGELCEEYARGFFEDDDYCRRVERAGWSIECADDVFVHHHLSASFDALGATAKRELFERNKAIYEAKWGDWQPHSYRDRPR